MKRWDIVGLSAATPANQAFDASASCSAGFFRPTSGDRMTDRHGDTPARRSRGATVWRAGAGLLAALAVTAFAPGASAQEEPEAGVPAPEVPAPECPPGAVCEATDVPGPAQAPEAVPPEAMDPDSTTVVLPPPPPGSNPNAPRWVLVHPDGDDGTPGQVIVYPPGERPAAARPAGLARPVPTKASISPKQPRRSLERHRRWGMNMRIDGVLIPRYKNDDGTSGMAGLGVGLRYRPVPAFALGFDADFIGGIDSNGYERQEVPMALSAIIYANPRDLAQFYLFGGVGWSFARVFSQSYETHLADGNSDEYSYFGGHLGAGLEFRVSRLVGLNLDGMAFLRSRTDDDGEGRYPEFYSPRTGEGSNTSLAGMLRGGISFWW